VARSGRLLIMVFVSCPMISSVRKPSMTDFFFLVLPFVAGLARLLAGGEALFWGGEDILPSGLRLGIFGTLFWWWFRPTGLLFSRPRMRLRTAMPPRA